MKQKQGLDLAAGHPAAAHCLRGFGRAGGAGWSPRWLIAPAVLVVAALGVLWYQRRRLRTFVAENLCSTDFENSRIQYSLTGLPIPTMLIADGRVLWYNDYLPGESCWTATDAADPACRPGFARNWTLRSAAAAHGQDLTVAERAVHRLRRRRQGQPRGQHRLPCGRYRSINKRWRNTPPAAPPA